MTPSCKMGEMLSKQQGNYLIVSDTFGHDGVYEVVCHFEISNYYKTRWTDRYHDDEVRGICKRS